MKEAGKMVTHLDMENSIIVMDSTMKDIGKMMCIMVMEWRHGRMELNMLDHS